MTQIVLPTHTNNHGTVFGGQLAAWIDICAAVSAQRCAKGPVVTASIDQLHFVAPVKKGMVVELRSQVNRTWRSSMEVGVRVEAEHPFTGERSHCCTAYLTFVAIGQDEKTRPVPELALGEADDERRWAAAQDRREVRLTQRKGR
ncbi:MAG: acyl-CoA thioesterase [Proteobacteria bacterium]|nr:acyl-CoA thioesterase [Pseudomonadota bacterium]MCP4919879.1 acyl-CoA thioesterase [Pseudomonadota bacterium]